MSTRILFGGAAFYNGTLTQADRVLDVLHEYGVNHIDTAASYGRSEELIGRWMGQHRGSFFLATKTGLRDADGARDEIRRSLDRLRVDSVDLLQLHGLFKPAEWEQAMAAGGALEAVLEAQEAGLTRFVGVTGHGHDVPTMHLRSLERHGFDSILLPYNSLLMSVPGYADAFERIYALATERSVAIQTIKSVARRPRPAGDQPYTTWYEPLTDHADLDIAVRWVLQRPGVFLNSPGDCDLLPRVLEAAARSRDEEALSDEAMRDWAEERGLEPIFPAPFDSNK